MSNACNFRGLSICALVCRVVSDDGDSDDGDDDSDELLGLF